MKQINDLDLKNWRNYLNDIVVDSLWLSEKKKNDGKFIIPKRESLRLPDSDFHGCFIPEIPYQFIKRFTREGETVWDCFAGSGTTKYVADVLHRNCICNDILPVRDFVVKADTRSFILQNSVQLIIMHPPYWNIVKFSEESADGSNCSSLENYLLWFEECVRNVVKFLDKGRFLILVCGNIYKDGEELTLGVWCKDVVRKYGFRLRSHIIKDYGETKGGEKNYYLNYYRCLKNHYNFFYGDNIFLLRKE